MAPFWPKSDRILVLPPLHPQPIAKNLGVRGITHVTEQNSIFTFSCSFDCFPLGFCFFAGVVANGVDFAFLGFILHPCHSPIVDFCPISLSPCVLFSSPMFHVSISFLSWNNHGFSPLAQVFIVLELV